MPYVTFTRAQHLASATAVALLTAAVALATTPCSAAEPQNDHQKFLRILSEKRANRPVIGPVHFDKPIRKGPPVEVREGEFLQEYADVKYQTAQKLTEQILQDNTAGIIFPGSLLWAAPLLQDARLDPVPLVRRPSVRVTLSSAVAAGASAGFVHDGTFSSFVEGSRRVISQITASEARLGYNSQISQNLQSTMLKANMSASGWFNKIGAMVSSSESTTRKYALVTVDQVYFMLTAEPATTSTFITPDLFQDAGQAQALLEAAAREGEPVYVRRVNYGRRLLLIIESESDESDLQRAINFRAKGFGLSADGAVDQKIRDTWSSMKVNALVIGGKVTDALIDTITGDPSKLMENINLYLKETKSITPDTSAAPLSFEVAYAVDGAQATNYETADFSGKIPGRRFLPEDTEPFTLPIALTPDNATKPRGDAEMDSDDWTYTKVEYRISGAGRQAGEIWVKYTAREGNADRSFGDTYFVSEKTFPIGPFNRTIKRFNVPASGQQEKWHGNGGRHLWQPFPNTGPLKNVRVSFDTNGGNDLNVMEMEGDVVLEVLLNKEQQ